MSKGSFQPGRDTATDDLAKRVRVLEDTLRKGRPHRLTDHTDVDLQGAASASALVRGKGAKWRPGSAGGPSVAYFNNPDGLLSSGYMRWFQLYTLGDTSWFVFPGDVGSGPDQSRIQIVSPGIITATVYLSAGLAFDSNISLGSNGVAGTGPNASALSFPAAGIFQAASIASTYQAVRVFTAGTSPVYGNLSLTFHPGEPVVTLY